MALMAASQPVADVFAARYGERLAAIIATCATGLHYPQLNRLNVRPGGLYRRVGATAGYSTWIFSQATFSAARALVYGSAPAARFGPRYVKGLRLLRGAFRLAGIDEESMLRTELPKGVYTCDVTGDGINALKEGVAPRGVVMTLSELTRWWREEILRPRLDSFHDPSWQSSFVASTGVAASAEALVA